MTWRVAITDAAGAEEIADLGWSWLSFTHVLNGPGSAEIRLPMSEADRADVEPGVKRYKIYQGSTLRAAGRIWIARVNTRYSEQEVRLIGEGLGGSFTRRLIGWEAAYFPDLTSPTYPAVQYGLSQEEMIFDLIDRSQAEEGGDLGITQGTHTGGSHPRKRWYCEEHGVRISDVIEEISGLADGIDWAITPTLTDTADSEFTTWNPSRGTDLSGTVHIAGTDILDVLEMEIDARQIITRGRSVIKGDCDPYVATLTDSSVLDYGLLEKFEPAESDQEEDADETAEALLSIAPIVDTDVEYQLSAGPALGTFDVGDTIRVSSAREGWGFDVDGRVQEVEVRAQLPDDDDHTFVRVAFSEIRALDLESS